MTDETIEILRDIRQKVEQVSAIAGDPWAPQQVYKILQAHALACTYHSDSDYAVEFSRRNSCYTPNYYDLYERGCVIFGEIYEETWSAMPLPVGVFSSLSQWMHSLGIIHLRTLHLELKFKP